MRHTNERSRARRLHAFGLKHTGRGRTRERLEQRLGRLALLAVGAKSRGIDRVVLDIRGQRTDQRDALHWKDLADLMNAELRLAASDVLCDRSARDQLRLRLDLSGDSELVEQSVDIDAARATGGGIDIGNRLSCEQRPLECVDRAEIRLRRPLLDHDADAYTPEIGPAGGDELALGGKVVDR